jgi:hypothetical protein
MRSQPKLIKARATQGVKKNWNPNYREQRREGHHPNGLADVTQFLFTSWIWTVDRVKESALYQQLTDEDREQDLANEECQADLQSSPRHVVMPLARKKRLPLEDD